MDDEEDDSESEIDTTTIPRLMKPPVVETCDPALSSLGLCRGDNEASNPQNSSKCGSNTSLSTTMSDRDACDNKSTASSVCESDKVNLASENNYIKTCKKCASIKASADEKIEEMKSQIIINDSKLQEKDDEIKLWKRKFDDRESEAKAEFFKMQSDLTGRLERAVRALDAAKKDKESAVMKYAFVEQDIASKQKAMEACEKRRVACEKEAASAIEKMKQAQAERAKMRQLLESKDNELIHSRKESDRLKLDLATLNQKLKVSHFHLHI